ncbi:MAG: DUF1929 domain-containing protein, partial [Burkholderiales bacterium]
MPFFHAPSRCASPLIAALAVAAALAGCSSGSDVATSGPNATPTPSANTTAGSTDVTALEVQRGVPTIDRGLDGDAGRTAKNSGTAPARDGQWSDVIPWPLIAIHAALNPDGTVLTYGADENGQESGQLEYAVFDPSTGRNTLLPNLTKTNLFCSAQTLLPSSGRMLLAGGDIRGTGQVLPDGQLLTNRGVRDVNVFDFRDRSLVGTGTPMARPRWYNSLLTLPDGRLLTLGGIDDKEQFKAVGEVEVFTEGQGWRTLQNANLSLPGNAWWYPRAWLTPNGRVTFMTEHILHSLDPNGAGRVFDAVGTLPFPSWINLPATMFDRGRVLMLGQGGQAAVVDLRGDTPTATPTGRTGDNRYWSTLTTLADGKVLLTGGGALDDRGYDNSGTRVALAASIWDPATGAWTDGASAQKSREYHSTAMLLPDATVLVGGGGAPGPVSQLNAEIYRPPYLFTASGAPAPRPRITSVPSTIAHGESFVVAMNTTAPIKRVTMVRAGSVTHSLDVEQRFLELPFRQNGNHLDARLDADANTAPPGFYMVFAIDAAGVPSVAKIVRVPVPRATVPPSAMLGTSITSFAGNTAIAMNGDADVSNDGALRLTSAKTSQAGSAWYRSPVTLLPTSSFVTRFQFRMGGGTNGDGFAFVVQGNDTMALGGAGGALGYGGIERSIAVKFDAYQNAGEPNDNHIAVLVNGSMVAIAPTPAPFRLADNAVHTAWVVYDGIGKRLLVNLEQGATNVTSTWPVLTVPLDLPAIVGDAMLMGFTAGTGGAVQEHRIEHWSFTAGVAPVPGADSLRTDRMLFPWQSLVSIGGQYFAQMQLDGNFVVYRNEGGGARPLWAT